MNDLILLLLSFLALTQILKLMHNTASFIYLKVKNEMEKFRLQQGSINVEDLHRLTSHEFEEWCGEYLEKCGYSDIRITPAGPDGGRDIICSLRGEKVYVECKRYSPEPGAPYKVDAAIVKKLAGAMVHDGIHRGMILTTGIVKEEARQFAALVSQEYTIEFLDGHDLITSWEQLHREDEILPSEA